MNDNYKLKLIFKTDSGEYNEHESDHTTIDEALDEANEIAFSTVGFNIESWQELGNFDEIGRLFVFYPNESDKTTRYVIRIFEF